VQVKSAHQLIGAGVQYHGTWYCSPTALRQMARILLYERVHSLTCTYRVLAIGDNGNSDRSNILS
jgi:hypothetical protein